MSQSSVLMPSDAEAPALAFLGDDFTGSTDAMQALAVQGVPTLLFLRTPDARALAAARGRYAAIGLAGVSRSQGPAWMDAHLPAAYAALAASGALLVHYKVCSTFDSSPALGSIGRAIELGRAAFPSPVPRATPVIVGAPALRRYTAFGHLYASGGERVWRIDRHPTMAAHPVTPMAEADLLRHLAAQTTLRGGLFDFTEATRPDARARHARAMADHEILLMDVLDEATLASAGRLLWQAACAQPGHPLFCVGSSGVEYGLIAAWRETGGLARPGAPPPGRASRVQAIAAVSGSCSPVTAAQITQAGQDGFACLRVAPETLLDDVAASGAALGARMLAALSGGRSVLAYTAQGPDDPAITQFRSVLRARGLDEADALARVGQALGIALRAAAQGAGLQRVAVAGGDTSGQVMQAMGISALRLHAAFAPGVPLCEACEPADGAPGLQVALKGGQMGGEGFFGDVRAGMPRVAG
ncbi:Predicted pyridoxine biosynthesis protein (probably from glycolaldehide) [plant metagenome]|uniref:Predicted pyridoxine biosynthesis protein (Probably from glycolaldehide) n=2 Tax=plant metagenome TaxID=1297885 RepID=A0A484TMH2_9ZZZZ